MSISWVFAVLSKRGPQDPKGNPHPRAGTPCGSFGGDRGVLAVVVEEWACVAWEEARCCFCWTQVDRQAMAAACCV
jgi:hypothetical protein